MHLYGNKLICSKPSKGQRLLLLMQQQRMRQVATAATAQVNRSNELNAKAVLDISNTAYNNVWQYYADVIEYAQDSAENDLDRNVNLAIAELTAQTQTDVAEQGRSSAAGQAVGGLIGTLGSAFITGGFF